MPTHQPDPERESVETVPEAAGQSPGPEVAEPDTASTYTEAVIANYSRWRAAQPLQVHGVLAFTCGSPVPADHPMVPVWAADGSITPIR